MSSKNTAQTTHPRGNTALDDCWFAVATVDQLDGEHSGPLAIQIRDVDYVIWRAPSGNLIATRDQCSHRQAPLSRGTLDDGCLRCPYHGWGFGSGGNCIEVPSASPGTPVPPSAHLVTLPVEEQYGLVWFSPGKPAEPIPHIGVEHEGSFTRLNTGMQTWNCSATRMIDNMLDVAHFPYTHARTFGREQEQQVPNFSLKQLDDTFYGYEYSVVVNNEGEAKAMSGDGADVIGLDMSTGFTLPFSVRSTMTYENGIEQVLFMTAAPISTERSYFTFILWRNDDVSTSGQQIVDFEQTRRVQKDELV